MKIRLMSIASIIAISVMLFSCNQNSNKNEVTNDNPEETKNVRFDELKNELNDIGDAIGDLFTNEQDNVKEAFQEVGNDLNRKIDEIQTEMGNSDQDNKDLKKQLDNLEKKADELEKNINKFDDEAEEEMAQLKSDIEKQYKAIQKDINKITNNN